MNIFWREIKANFKSLLIWCGAQIFVIMSGMMKYGGYVSSGIDIDELMNQFPAALRAVFTTGQAGLGDIRAFYAIFFLFFILLSGIHAAMLGAVIISKEERDHAADFLYAKPVSRPAAITAKLAAGLVNVLILNLLTFVASLYFISIYNQGNPELGMVATMMLALILLQVLFLGIGAALGASLRTTRAATSALTGIILGSFILSVGIDIEKRLAFLKWVTPFKFFDTQDLVFDHNFRIAPLLLCMGLTALCTWITYNRFGRRDLTT